METIRMPLELFHNILSLSDEESFTNLAKAFPVFVKHYILNRKDYQSSLFLCWMIHSLALLFNPDSFFQDFSLYLFRKPIIEHYVLSKGWLIVSFNALEIFIKTYLGTLTRLLVPDFNFPKRIWHHTSRHLILHQFNYSQIKNVIFDITNLNVIYSNTFSVESCKSFDYDYKIVQNCLLRVCKFCNNIDKSNLNAILSDKYHKTCGEWIFSISGSIVERSTPNKMSLRVKQSTYKWYPCDYDKILIVVRSIQRKQRWWKRKTKMAHSCLIYHKSESIVNGKRQYKLPVYGYKNEMIIKSDILPLDESTLLFVDNKNRLFYIVKSDDHWRIEFKEQFNEYRHPVKCFKTNKILFLK